MTILGVQLGLTLIFVSVLSKLGGKFSLARWLLCNTGLIRYLHPSDDVLRELGNVPKDMTSGRGKGKYNKDLKNPDVFHVPKNIDLQLETVKVSAIEVMNLKFYAEYHWVIDYTVQATIVYILTEIYYGFFNPASEMNLSVYWSLLSIGMSIGVLCSITSIYFQGDEVIGERAMCLVMGLFYLLVAMMILIVDERNLEIGVDSAYTSFYQNALQFMEKQGVDNVGPASKLIIKFFIALAAGFLGLLFTFPGIRMSKMFIDSLKYCEERPIVKAGIYFTYAMPLFLVVLWIRPLGRYFFTEVSMSTSNGPLMSNDTFDSFRLIMVILFVLSKFILMPFFLQAFLNVAQMKLFEQQKEAGRILNTQLQKQIAGIYYYLCVVALQYIVPCLILFQFTLLYKTLGEQQWSGSYRDSWPVFQLSQRNKTSEVLIDLTKEAVNSVDSLKNVTQASEQFLIALGSLKLIFNDTVFRGLFGFATWWSLFLIFSTSAVGTLYTTYLTRA